MFSRIAPTIDEVATSLPGDDLVTDAQAIIDRAFTLAATPEQVWPWFMQLGKHRAGWYFPRWVERFEPPKRRGLRVIEQRFQNHQIGDRIDDWGGKNGYLDLVQLLPNRAIVYQSIRGTMHMSWALAFQQQAGTSTRVHIRLRLNGVKHTFFLKTIGEFFDAVTIAGLEAGLRERLM